MKRRLILAGLLGMAMTLTACRHTRGEEEAMVPSDQGAQAQGLGQDGDFHGWGTSTQAPANQSYYFAFDKSEVNGDDMASIDAQAQYLLKHPKAHIRIEGNTDARGSREYNVALGYRRARAVASAMKLKGVSAGQMSIISWGREKPVALGDSEEAYRQNRRVDLVYDQK